MGFFGKDRRRVSVRNRAAQFVDLLLSPWRFFKVVCFCVGLSVILAGIGTTLYVAAAYRALPDIEHMDFKEARRVAVQRVDDQLEDKHKSHPWTELKDVSRECLYSIVMSEDSTFFEHDGFNVEAMIDSLAEDIKQRKMAYGASTLTQQVAKNLFLSRQKALVRKFKEVWVTRALEKRFTKNQIVELYLNVAEFGPDIFGISAAAKHYFNKAPADINAAEGAFLGLMLPSPRKNHFIVFENGNLNPSRRRHIRRVLNDMLYAELITEEQYTEYRHYDFFDVDRQNSDESDGHRNPAQSQRRK